MPHHLNSGFIPGTLWPQVQRCTQQALASGALQPIDTQHEYVEQQGMRFLVRILASLRRKEAAQSQAKMPNQTKDFNPFLPYEEALFVTHLSPTHLCLLNKYNVVEHHMLIVTRQFEEQDSWLNQEDFWALATCMAEVDGLAFYNGGRLAGASQRHKHLQLIPTLECPDGSPLPIEPLLETVLASGHLGSSPSLPFRHSILALNLNWQASPLGLSDELLKAYSQLMQHAGIEYRGRISPQPYNLLLTRRWMMLVLRCQDSYRSIPINSLGFAGSLLVKNQAQMDLLKTIGPMTLLKKVACADG